MEDAKHIRQKKNEAKVAKSTTDYDNNNFNAEPCPVSRAFMTHIKADDK